jgi:protein-disulfide isomerase
MLNYKGSLTGAALLAIGLAACGPNAESEPRSSVVPETAQSREDVEKIVRAYILENPEIITEAMDILADREKAEIAKLLASDSRDVSYGPDDADITIVEFFDYNCGYCKKSMDWVLSEVDDGDGNIRVIFKELPILSEQSRQAALAALAADRQGKYMEFHQLLMRQKAHTLTDDKINELADSIDLNVTRMRKDMEREELLDHIQDVRELAIEFGATATPSFFVNGELIQGFDQSELERQIAELSK